MKQALIALLREVEQDILAQGRKGDRLLLNKVRNTRAVLEDKLAPTAVRRALDHVRAVFPDVTHVMYTREGKWLYMNNEGRMPAFGKNIDVGLLEDAQDEVDNTCGFPAAFCVEAP